MTDIFNVSITGGVSANKYFRHKSDQLIRNINSQLYFPPLKYCTDNPAMIAIAGYQQLQNGHHSSLSLEANPNLALNEINI